MAGTMLVPMELGGRTRNLRLGINALSELNDILEKRQGRSVNLMLVLAGALKVNTIRSIFYCGLKWEDEALAALSFDEGELKVGRWMEDYIEAGGRMTDFGATVDKALRWSFPEPAVTWGADAVEYLSELGRVVPVDDKEIVETLGALSKIIGRRVSGDAGEDVKEPVPFDGATGLETPSESLTDFADSMMTPSDT